MPQAKRASKGKRPSKAVSVLGIAGVSLAASTGGSPAVMPSASLAAPTPGSVVDALWQNTAPFQVPTLDEEEISDVSLATFYLFDKENLGNSQSSIQFRGGCGCGHGCGGEAAQLSRLRRRLSGLRRWRLQRLRRWRLQRLRHWRLQRLRRWRLRLGRLRRLRRLERLGLGWRLLLVVGRLLPLLDWIALQFTLTDARRHRVRPGTRPRILFAALPR